MMFRIPTRIAAAILSTLLVTGSSLAMDPPVGVRPGPLFVKDATGNVLGTYLGEVGEANAARVARMVGTKAVYFRVTPQFDDPDGTVIGFDGPNCTGTPYIYVRNQETMATFGRPVGAGPRLYYQVGPAQTAPPLVSIMVTSNPADCALNGVPPPGTFIPPAGCCYGCGGGSCTGTNDQAPAAMVDLSEFVPPLRVGP